MEPKIGLQKKVRREIAEVLLDLLADTYALYLKTQNFHWNVVSPHFSALHLLFEKQYEELAEAIDEIAERIRSLDEVLHATFAELQKRTQITDSKPHLNWKKMVEELKEGNESLSARFRPFIHRFQDLFDDVSSDLLIRRLAVHEKAAWMLRSTLEV